MFISIQEQFDFSKPTGKLILGILAALARFERENLLERQRAGIEAAKLRGAFKGREWIKLENSRLFELCFERYTETKSYTMKDFQTSTGLKESTLLKFVRLRRQLGETFPNRKDLTIKILRHLVEEKKKQVRGEIEKTN